MDLREPGERLLGRGVDHAHHHVHVRALRHLSGECRVLRSVVSDLGVEVVELRRLCRLARDRHHDVLRHRGPTAAFLEDGDRGGLSDLGGARGVEGGEQSEDDHGDEREHGCMPPVRDGVNANFSLRGGGNVAKNCGKVNVTLE